MHTAYIFYIYNYILRQNNFPSNYKLNDTLKQLLITLYIHAYAYQCKLEVFHPEVFVQYNGVKISQTQQ